MAGEGDPSDRKGRKNIEIDSKRRRSRDEVLLILVGLRFSDRKWSFCFSTGRRRWKEEEWPRTSRRRRRKRRRRKKKEKVNEESYTIVLTRV